MDFSRQTTKFAVSLSGRNEASTDSVFKTDSDIMKIEPEASTAAAVVRPPKSFTDVRPFMLRKNGALLLEAMTSFSFLSRCNETRYSV